MDATTLVLVARLVWLTLCGMMLFSRFLFQAKGATWMRAFLDAWKNSTAHRVWGWVALAAGLFLLASAVPAWSSLSFVDRVVVTSLVVILGADGLLNLFPGSFGHFKERVQDVWVRKNPGHKSTDRHLFSTVNVFLGAAASLAAGAVYGYRPLAIGWVALAMALAVCFTLLLVALCMVERRRANQPTNRAGHT